MFIVSLSPTLSLLSLVCFACRISGAARFDGLPLVLYHMRGCFGTYICAKQLNTLSTLADTGPGLRPTHLDAAWGLFYLCTDNKTKRSNPWYVVRRDYRCGREYAPTIYWQQRVWCLVYNITLRYMKERRTLRRAYTR